VGNKIGRILRTPERGEGEVRESGVREPWMRQEREAKIKRHVFRSLWVARSRRALSVGLVGEELKGAGGYGKQVVGVKGYKGGQRGGIGVTRRGMGALAVKLHGYF